MPNKLFLSLLLFLFPSIVSAAVIGTITRSSREVSFRTSATASYEKLSEGRVMNEGEWLKTGKNGWLELTLTDKSRLTLADNTEFELTRFKVGAKRREGSFNLVEGKLRASIVKLAGKQTDIRVKSVTAVAGVRGTEFMMLCRGPANIFFGNEGTVSVAGNGQEERLLSPQTMTQTTRGGIPVTPVKIDPGSPLEEAKTIFERLTGTEPPQEWQDADNLTTIVSRWNVNYGHYLADRGDYDQSLHLFQIAIDLTQVPEVRADARLERGTVQGRFLNNPRAALAEYLLVLEEYPKLPQAEIALYTIVQTLFDLQLYDQAGARLSQYLATYPMGRFRGNLEALRRQIDEFLSKP